MAAAAITVIAVFLLYHGEKDVRVCFASDCFDVEVANTTDAREKGLMHRENLNQNRGMLFIFPEENIYSFWMKNTLITLDIIWLNSNQEIVFISSNNQPCQPDNCLSVNPGIKAKYVLEINAGLSEKIGLGIGQRMNIYTKK